MKTSVELHSSAIMGAALIAYLIAGRDWLTTGLIFIICLGIIEASVLFLIKRRFHGIRQEEAAFRRSLEVPLDNARSQALAAIASGDHCKPVVGTDVGVRRELPDTVSEIFSRYTSITFPAGDLLELGSKERGFVHVGRTYDGAELIVREADQGLFESEGPDLPRPEDHPDYPSLLHWIVVRTVAD